MVGIYWSLVQVFSLNLDLSFLFLCKLPCGIRGESCTFHGGLSVCCSPAFFLFCLPAPPHPTRHSLGTSTLPCLPSHVLYFTLFGGSFPFCKSSRQDPVQNISWKFLSACSCFVPSLPSRDHTGLLTWAHMTVAALPLLCHHWMFTLMPPRRLKESAMGLLMVSPRPALGPQCLELTGIITSYFSSVSTVPNLPFLTDPKDKQLKREIFG